MEEQKRFHNFSPEEINLLVSLVEKYSNIIESKKSDAVAWKTKNEAWELLTTEFNASDIAKQNRNSKNLKEKWKNIKKESKKKFADEKKEIFKTGGGHPSSISIIDERDQKVKTIIGVAVTGLPNTYDSDGPLAPFSGPDLNQNDIEFIVETDDNDILDVLQKNGDTPYYDLQKNEEKDATDMKNKQSIAKTVDCQTKGNEETWNNWSPALLQQKKSIELQSKKQKIASGATPKRQKKSQLTTDCRLKISAVSDAKLELIQLQIECLKQDQKLKEQEHNLKMEYLKKKFELEIEEKKLQCEMLRKEP